MNCLDLSKYSKFTKVRNANVPFRRTPDGQERVISVVTLPAPNRDAQTFLCAEGLDTDTNNSPERIHILAQNIKRVCLEQVQAGKFDDEIIEMNGSIDPADIFTNFGRDLSSTVPMSTNTFEEGLLVERGRVTMIGDALHARTTH